MDIGSYLERIKVVDLKNKKNNSYGQGYVE